MNTVPERTPDSASRRDDPAACSRFRVLLTDRAWPDWDVERQILGQIGADLVTTDDVSEDSLVQLARDVDAIGTCWAKVTEAVIRASSRCRIVCRFGIGLDNIDVGVATRLGIPVTNNPDYCVEEVSDHVLAMLLGWERNLVAYDRALRSGSYDINAGRRMQRVRGRRLGIVGLGRIGQAVAGKAAALGLHVCAWTRSGNPRATGCRMYATLEELLEHSDYVTVHLPLNAETRHLFGMRQFERMRPGALLINTSRGGLIDQQALLQALESEQLGGAALDVFEPEPPDLREPLFAHPRLMATPHAAFVSEQSLLELRRTAAEQIVSVLRGEIPHNVINPSVLTRPR